MIQRCRRCGHAPTYPRIACPRCLAELVWRPHPGTGMVESFTVIHRPHADCYRPHVPIVMALIGLDDGPQVISTIVGDDRLRTEIGARVEPAAGGQWSKLPQFRLA